MAASRSVNSGKGPMPMGGQGDTTMVEPGNDSSDDDATKPLPEQPDAGGAPTERIGAESLGAGAADPDAPTQVFGAPFDASGAAAGGSAATEPIAPHVPIADLGATAPVGVPDPGGQTSARSRKSIAPWILGGLAAVLIVILGFAILPGLLNGTGVVTGPSVSPSPSQTPSTGPSEAPSAAPTVEDEPSSTPDAPDPGNGGDDPGPEPTQNPPPVPSTDPVPEPTVSVGP
jgi:hypothetical protein